ncbi:MAG: hypothetical protein IJ867_04540 [Clostridia bacterium]|nr:hypothetical protein [Clostridia bacterium]
MKQDLVHYVAQDGDVLLIKKEFADQFEGNRFLEVFIDSEEDAIYSSGASGCYELPDKLVEEYLWSVQEQRWFAVLDVDWSIEEITSYGDTTYMLEPIDDATNEYLDALLDAADIV